MALGWSLSRRHKKVPNMGAVLQKGRIWDLQIVKISMAGLKGGGQLGAVWHYFWIIVKSLAPLFGNSLAQFL